MANINLLPWRDEYRREKQQEFLTVIGCVVFLAVVCGYFWVSSINSSIEGQNARNTYLKSEIAVLDKKVTEIKKLKERREQLIERMKVIQGLQGERPVIVRYFDELVRAIPEGVYFTSLIKDGANLSVSGVAESNVRVSALMRNIDRSDWFTSPNLSSVKSAPQIGEQASTFALTFMPGKPKDKEVE
jgi:type IV pilus assembly protein PilN